MNYQMTDLKSLKKTDNDANKITDFILNLMPGKSLDLQFSIPVLVRMKLTLVGYDAGNFLILKYPSGQVSEYADVLQTGNVAIVRYIDEGRQGECVAFTASISAIINVKARLIFLEYPKSIENRQLRSSQRLQTHIPGKIELLTSIGVTTGNSISGVIIDISSKGCQFTFKTDNNKVKVKKSDIIISIGAASQNEQVKIKALVRNSRFENGKVYVGIQFSGEESKRVATLLSSLAIEDI